MRKTKGQPRISSTTSIQELPEMLNRRDIEEYLGVGRTSAYRILKARGVKVLGHARLPKAALLDMLQAASWARNDTILIPAGGNLHWQATTEAAMAGVKCAHDVGQNHVVGEGSREVSVAWGRKSVVATLEVYHFFGGGRSDR